jgi:hypothetical protein
MKAVILALTLAGVASTTPLNAQILGGRLPTPSTSRSGGVDGSWRVVGRDGNGNTVYERRTYDANGNIVIQRARRDGNGNMSIIGSQTVSNRNDRSNRRNRNGNNCDYTQASSVGDIIFGNGSSSANCDDRGNRVDGQWYPISRDRSGNEIYERRTYDGNGNVIIQRARRDQFGNMTIISTRNAGNNGTWNGNRRRGGDDNDDNDDNGGGRWNNGNNDNRDHNFDNSERGNRGRGKHKGRDD